MLSKQRWVKLEQAKVCFIGIEFQTISKPIQKSNHVLDNIGTLRIEIPSVAGRLQHAAMTRAKNNPILLPQRNYLSRLIVDLITICTNSILNQRLAPYSHRKLCWTRGSQVQMQWPVSRYVMTLSDAPALSLVARPRLHAQSAVTLEPLAPRILQHPAATIEVD